MVHSCIPEPEKSVSVKNLSLDSEWVSGFFRDSGLHDRFAERPFAISGGHGIDPFPESMPREHHVFQYCISEYFHSLSPEMPESGRSGRRQDLERVTEYLCGNYEEEVTLDDLSAISGLSKYHLIRKFRERYNLTPYAYLLNIRMNAAKSMLKRDIPISDIAWTCGSTTRAISPTPSRTMWDCPRRPTGTYPSRAIFYKTTIICWLTFIL